MKLSNLTIKAEEARDTILTDGHDRRRWNTAKYDNSCANLREKRGIGCASSPATSRTQRRGRRGLDVVVRHHPTRLVVDEAVGMVERHHPTHLEEPEAVVFTKRTLLPHLPRRRSLR